MAEDNRHDIGNVYGAYGDVSCDSVIYADDIYDSAFESGLKLFHQIEFSLNQPTFAYNYVS